MQHLIEIAPVLGAYGSERGVRPTATFGDPAEPRYAPDMTGRSLGWTSEERSSAIVLAPQGRIDETTADEFKQRLIEAVEAGPSAAVLDLAGVAYMSSRGLRALTLAQRAGQKHDTTLVLARPNDAMREILEISRYDMVFRIADSIEDAIGH